MATELSTFLAQVQILLGPDDSNTELGDTELNEFIKAAVERYSRDSPDDSTDDVSGDGGRFYDITASLTSWVEGFSHIIEIEFPAATIANDETPVYLDRDDWRDDYFEGGTRYLFLPNHAPAATDTMRIKYTIPYTFSSNQTDTPAQDFYAICHLAAGLACQAIATKYSRTSDSTIASDSVNHTSRAGEFARRAREFISFYNEHLGLGTDDGTPEFQHAEGEFVDWDTMPGWPSRRFLFHDRETR